MSRIFVSCIVICLFGNIGEDTLSAQSSFEDEFNTYQAAIEEEMSTYTDSIDADFALFLEQAWLEFMVYEGTKPTIYTGGIRQTSSFKTVSFENYLPAESSLFFGQSVDISTVVTPPVRLRDTSEKQVASAWRVFSESGLTLFLNDCSQVRRFLGLNDWGYYLLLRQMTQQRFPSLSANEQVVLLFYLLNHSGYKAKVGRSGDVSLILLLPFNEEVYYCPFIKVGEEKYYVWAAGKEVLPRLYSFARDYQEEAHCLSLSVSTPVTFSGQSIVKDRTYAGHKPFQALLNRSVLDYYATWPLCNLLVYFKAQPSVSFARSLDKALSGSLSGKSVFDQIAFLLHFVQNSFIHKPDVEVHGVEKYYFPEEVFYYSYSDCEDLSVFLAYLVHHFTGKEILILYYPEHVAIAVEEMEGYTGSFLQYKGKRYFICDPSYKDAAPGKVIPACDSLKPLVEYY